MREPDHDDDVDDNENNDDDNDECVPPALSWRSCHHEHSHRCRTCLQIYHNPIFLKGPCSLSQKTNTFTTKNSKRSPFIVSCPIPCNINATAVELRKTEWLKVCCLISDEDSNTKMHL